MLGTRTNKAACSPSCRSTSSRTSRYRNGGLTINHTIRTVKHDRASTVTQHQANALRPPMMPCLSRRQAKFESAGVTKLATLTGMFRLFKGELSLLLNRVIDQSHAIAPAWSW